MRLPAPARTLAFVALAALAGGFIFNGGLREAAGLASLPSLVAGDSIWRTGPARPMPICSTGKRVNCVVDGDTIWLDGEKMRLEGFNTPEMDGVCELERQLAVQARDRLQNLISGRALTVTRNGKDRYDRTLATIKVSGRDVGESLIADGLAHRWQGRKESWCG